MTHEHLTTFFGWMSVLNIAFLLLATLGLVLLRPMAIRLHRAFFALEEEALNRAYFRYLANIKVLTLIFCITPWIALKMM